ncbi:SMODS domain-containing nucleotidyltransferase [Bradyrhizobium japonicum]|uniref:SMODS domain-containing nucleotidyltransferase n=1 Tax=Bradyrhizobium japonicum TaxID=375 RepID=UPI0032DEFC69
MPEGYGQPQQDPGSIFLEASIPALRSFVRDSDWKPKVRSFVEQGSWAHQTIIRPVDGGEFDADLLVMVDPVDGWTAAD